MALAKVRIRRFPSLIGLPVALVLAHSDPVSATPLGGEFQINQTTVGDQLLPALAARPGGGFLVVWRSSVSPGDDSDSNSILLRTVDAEGSPVGTEEQVNLLTTYSQGSPQISSRGDGSFIVQWSSFFPGSKGLVTSIQARPYDAEGVGADSEFQVEVSPNIYTNIFQHDVAAAANGQFVTVFSDYYNAYTGFYQTLLKKKRFDAAGSSLEFSTLAGVNQTQIFFDSRLDGDETDGFVVVWAEVDLLFSGYSTGDALRLDSEGATIGSAIPLFPELDLVETNSIDVATVPGGEFMTAWNGLDLLYGYSNYIYSRRVDTTDVPDPAGPTVVNSYTTSTNSSIRMARGADGSFLVVWASFNALGDEGRGVRGRFLEPDGTPRGEEFRVNEFTTGNQLGAEVEASDDGKTFLVVWHTESGPGSDDDQRSISGQRFLVDRIFADDFESGDTTGWPTIQP